MTDFNRDGPYSPELTTAAARRIAELVRYLNYSTRVGYRGIQQPGDVYDLLGALCTATGWLPQLLAQVDNWLAVNADRMAADDGGSVGGLITSAGAELHYAEGFARDLTARLQSAQNAIAKLSVKNAGDD